MKNQLRDVLAGYKGLLLTSSILVLIDQISKYLVRANLAPGEIYPQGHQIVHFARIINWHNTGAILGILKNQGILLIIYALLISALIIFLYPRLSKLSRALGISLSLILAGSLGNMIDRLHQGFVTDFISIGNLPAFNIADICLLAGMSAAFIVWYRWDDKNTDANPQANISEKRPTSSGGAQ